MKTNERRSDKRGRVLRGAEQRWELVAAFRSSGQSQAAFCRDRGVNAQTFNGWLRQAAAKPMAFAQVEVVRTADRAADAPASVEVLLPNGARIGIRHQGRRDELVALIRGVAGYGEAQPC
jgi:hypothetical protein